MFGAKTRIEHDLIGDLPVPAEAYYGIHTLRAAENFPISDTKICIYPDLIQALACIKQAAAMTNRELGLLDPSSSSSVSCLVTTGLFSFVVPVHSRAFVLLCTLSSQWRLIVSKVSRNLPGSSYWGMCADSSNQMSCLPLGACST